MEDKVVRLRTIETVDEAPSFLRTSTRPESQCRHVLNRNMQEKSGRLYCADDSGPDIPAVEIYAAR